MGRQLIPRGVELLVKKAAVDADFRQMLLDRRSAAAPHIGLRLTPAETKMPDTVPRPQLLAIVQSTRVTPPQRKALLGTVAAAMLAALGMTHAGADAGAAVHGEAGDDRIPQNASRPERPAAGQTRDVGDDIYSGEVRTRFGATVGGPWRPPSTPQLVALGPNSEPAAKLKSLPPMLAEIVLGRDHPRTESNDVPIDVPAPPAPIESLSPFFRELVSPATPRHPHITIIGGTLPRPDREPPPPKPPPVAPEANPGPHVSLSPEGKSVFPPPEFPKPRDYSRIPDLFRSAAPERTPIVPPPRTPIVTLAPILFGSLFAVPACMQRMRKRRSGAFRRVPGGGQLRRIARSVSARIRGLRWSLPRNQPPADSAVCSF